MNGRPGWIRRVCRVALGLVFAIAIATPNVTIAAPTLALEASARAAVPNDEMAITLAVERDGPQPGALNEAVIAQLNSALAEARSVEAVRARLGQVWTQPNFTREGRPQGWRVRGEIVIESTRLQPLAQLGGRLAERMLLTAVQFRLSGERRRTEERRLLAEAAQAFRSRAAEAAVAFGFSGYEIKEIALRGAGGSVPRPMSMARAPAEAASSPLPTEGGDSDVVVTVSGTVELRP